MSATKSSLEQKLANMRDIKGPTDVIFATIQYSNKFNNSKIKKRL